MAEFPKHVPIGLTKGAVMRRTVEPGQTLELDDIELPDRKATHIALQLVKQNT